MDTDNQDVRHDDPQFAKVLETCLIMEIATLQENLDASTEEIKQLKGTVRSELNRRKELKEKMAQMDKINLILNDTLSKLYVSINETSDTLETMKANADDQYQLIQMRTQECENIVDEYKKTWEEYRAMYEEFPLAKARNAAKNKLEKLKIEYMVMSYKKAEIAKVIKQRRHINWIRLRCSIIEFSAVMVERSKLIEKFTKLNETVKCEKQKLQSIKEELEVYRRKEEDQKKQRKQKILEMAPPKINIPYREMCAQNQMRATMQHQIHEPLDDVASVNTLFLEELCINENTTVLSEQMEREAAHDNNYELPAVETKTSNSKNTVIPEKDDTCDALVASDTVPSAEKATLTDNDVEMKETHHEGTWKLQESVKTQPSYCTKENPLKHSAAKNTQDEIEAKRIRLQRQDSKESINKITTSRSSTSVKEMNLKPLPPSVPKIKKIENVHYNVTPLMPIPKPIQRPTVTASSMFSPMTYEYCDSNISSMDQDFESKDLPSYAGSLHNYRSSMASNITFSCIDENAQTAFSPKHVAQQNNKTESDDKTASFEFGNITTKAQDDVF